MGNPNCLDFLDKTGLVSIKGFTQSKLGNAFENKYQVIGEFETLPHLPWVDSFLHDGPA